MSKSLRSRALFFDHVLTAVEEARALPDTLLSRHEQIRHIRTFFSEIGCTITPPILPPNVEFPNVENVEAFIAAFIERMSVNEDFFSEYFNLITTGVSGSNYIEDLLYDLLNTTDHDGINVCVNLLMCPLKVYFKLFIDFTRPRDPQGITPQNAIEYFNIFMVKSQLIIMKKLELIDFLKMQTADFQFDDDIINVLTRRFIMCLEFFKSTMSRAGFSKELYDTVLEHFNSSYDLRDHALRALGRLKGQLFSPILILQVKEKRSEQENEQLALFLKRKKDVERMIADLNELIPLINASIDLFHENSQLTNAATVVDTGRLQRRQQQQEQEQRRRQSQHDNVGGRKRQKKCKNTKKCKNKKKSSRNKKKSSRNKKKSSRKS